MLIARRADTRARADFATWKMMAKLNGASALPAEAQNFLATYKKHLGEMSEADATETTILALYKAYYAEMGGIGAPPDVQRRPAEPVADNVTAFRRPAPRPKSQSPFNMPGKQQLPVLLIFACLVVVWVGIRYLWK
ncbi:MAG TPA: hypothetical protein VK734_06885 [Bradyrhizobium sp.]|jgi:hypothetical protein|nr:hypothetical protein [Bradyrhizobium sp.]